MSCANDEDICMAIDCSWKTMINNSFVSKFPKLWRNAKACSFQLMQKTMLKRVG